LELLQQCEAFTNTIASSKNELSGRASIAVIDTLVSDPRCGVAATIAALRDKSSSIQFDINVCEAREVETSVANGRSLVGVGVSRHHLRGLEYFPLHNETNFLYCALGHPLFDCKASQENKLLQQADVISSNYVRDRETRNDNLNYQNSATAYHDEGLAHLILSGRFIGYLPEHYASYWVDKGIFRAIKPERYSYTIPVVLITAKNNMASPLANALVEQIKQSHSLLSE
jgi:DNA-binding transcriptional LysR family regulator